MIFSRADVECLIALTVLVGFSLTLAITSDRGIAVTLFLICTGTYGIIKWSNKTDRIAISFVVAITALGFLLLQISPNQMLSVSTLLSAGVLVVKLFRRKLGLLQPAS